MINKLIFLRDFLFPKRSANYYLLTTLRDKQRGIDLCQKELETLVLGSSHGDYGFNPIFTEKKSFNLAHSSQDLYYSYHLYQKYAKQCSKLENVVIFYSVFSQGNNLYMQKKNDLVCFYKIIFGCKYFSNFKDLLLDKKEGKYRKWYKKYKRVPKGEYYGFEAGKYFLKKISTEIRASSHLRENKREDNLLGYLQKIVTLAKEKQHQLYIVLSPGREDYKQECGDSKRLFTAVFEMQNKLDLKIINLYDNVSFNDNDFGDCDHLNSNGAEKATKIINKIINSKETHD